MTQKSQKEKTKSSKINKDKVFFLLLAGVTIGTYVAGFILWGQV